MGWQFSSPSKSEMGQKGIPIRGYGRTWIQIDLEQVFVVLRAEDGFRVVIIHRKSGIFGQTDCKYRLVSLPINPFGLTSASHRSNDGGSIWAPWICLQTGWAIPRDRFSLGQIYTYIRSVKGILKTRVGWTGICRACCESETNLKVIGYL
jgi:hypothetical protein